MLIPKKRQARRRYDSFDTSSETRKSVTPNYQTLIVLVFVSGALALAVLDHNFRSTFGDLAKIVVSGYIGWTMPHR